MKIHKGDTVLIIKGKDRKKKGKVLRALPKKGKLVVEGINLKKRHIRPRRPGEKGEIVSLPGPINISSVKLVCPKCRKAAKIGYKISLKKGKKIKVRICKKCGKEIG